jgi:hypothetical protein
MLFVNIGTFRCDVTTVRSFKASLTDELRKILLKTIMRELAGTKAGQMISSTNNRVQMRSTMGTYIQLLVV